MIRLDKVWESSATPVVVGFDLEWTKNYRIARGSKPFCFSFVCLPIDVCLDATIHQADVGIIARYAEVEDEFADIAMEADQLMDRFLQADVMLVGHQLSSDLATLINYSPDLDVDNLSRLREVWRRRRGKELSGNGLAKVFDTRYDADAWLSGKSRRLVDVCIECGLEVTQPELRSKSMTALQNEFLQTQDHSIMERLATLNIRHCLSSVLLYLIF